jgi:predicted XRE-type DNA-binding protein
MAQDIESIRNQVTQMARNVCEFLMANAKNALSMNPTMSQAMIGRIALSSSQHWITQSFSLDDTPFTLKDSDITIEIKEGDTLQAIALKVARAEIEHKLKKRGLSQAEREELLQVAVDAIDQFFRGKN